MKKIPITKPGFDNLKKELEYLKTVSLLENIRDIETARAHGTSLKTPNMQPPKNASRSFTAKCRNWKIIWRYPKSLISRTSVMTGLSFGSTVRIEDVHTGKEIKYQLVGPFESDINKNKISVTSPIGKAMIGKEVGDEVTVQAPGGIREFQIVNIMIEEIL